MRSIFNQLKQAFSARFRNITYKLKNLTNPNFLKNRVLARIRAFFVSLFNFKPRDKDDYYNILRWQVSKKLAYLIVIAVGLISFIFLYTNYYSYGNGKEANVIKTYDYNSLLLRFTSGNVRIKGKSGYLAYEGQVAKGKVSGKGTLYDPQGNIVYVGEFENNDYNGTGKKYYTNGVVEYEGGFVGNKFEGTGNLYRQNGSKAYSGGFLSGIKQGEGIFYNNSSGEVYTGAFWADNILYSDLVGRSASDIAEKYVGKRILYEGNDVFNVVMSDIEAMYQGSLGLETLNDEIQVEDVYVLQQYISVPTGKISDIDGLTEYFGSPLYEGYSDATASEMIAMDEVIKKTADQYFDYIELDVNQEYEDYYLVKSMPENVQVYLTVYSNSGMLYSFVSRSKGEPFGFYFLTKEDGSVQE